MAHVAQLEEEKKTAELQLTQNQELSATVTGTGRVTVYCKP